tara:strand:- start:51 stop:410 length:360 start_codon:yes stop_codon:yes gene_type:complete
MSSRIILKSKIEHLIELKNNYDDTLKKVEMIRNQKNELEEEINNIIQSLNMCGKTIIVNNQKILQKTVSISQSLTFKYIEATLEKYIYDKNDNTINIKEFIEYIKINRPKYIKTEIKID